MEKGLGNVPNGYHSSEDDSDNSQKRKIVMLCLAEIAEEVLTQRQQEIISRVMAGEKQIQIANSLGLSKSSVSRTYHRGMEKLSKHAKHLGMFLR